MAIFANPSNLGLFDFLRLIHKKHDFSFSKLLKNYLKKKKTYTIFSTLVTCALRQEMYDMNPKVNIYTRGISVVMHKMSPHPSLKIKERILLDEM